MIFCKFVMLFLAIFASLQTLFDFIKFVVYSMKIIYSKEGKITYNPIWDFIAIALLWTSFAMCF